MTDTVQIPIEDLKIDGTREEFARIDRALRGEDFDKAESYRRVFTQLVNGKIIDPVLVHEDGVLMDGFHRTMLYKYMKEKTGSSKYDKIPARIVPRDENDGVNEQVEQNVIENEISRILMDEWIKVGTGRVDRSTDKAVYFQGNWYPKHLVKVVGDYYMATVYVRRGIYIQKQIQDYESDIRDMRYQIRKWEASKDKEAMDEFASEPLSVRIAKIDRKIQQNREYIKEREEYLKTLKRM